jgi:hypothetical protein
MLLGKNTGILRVPKLFRLAFINLTEQTGQIRRAVHRVLMIVIGQHVRIGDKHTAEALSGRLGIKPVSRRRHYPGIDAREQTGFLNDPAPRRFNPDKIPILDSQLFGRFRINHENRVLHEAAQPGDIAVLSQEIERRTEAGSQYQRIFLI